MPEGFNVNALRVAAEIKTAVHTHSITLTSCFEFLRLDIDDIMFKNTVIEGLFTYSR